MTASEPAAGLQGCNLAPARRNPSGGILAGSVVCIATVRMQQVRIDSASLRELSLKLVDIFSMKRKSYMSPRQTHRFENLRLQVSPTLNHDDYDRLSN